jgi:hypothetical protein
MALCKAKGRRPKPTPLSLYSDAVHQERRYTPGMVPEKERCAMSPQSKALSFALLPALLLVFLVTPSLAVPLYLKSGKCSCYCTAGKFEVYEGKAYDCDAFNGKTCNAEDPKTGIIKTGRLQDCGDQYYNPKTPKVKPGGAEQPGTESPGVRPKGGVQRY